MLLQVGIQYYYDSCWYLLTVEADKRQYSDRNSSRRLGRASLGVSVAGVIIGVVALSVLLALSV